MRSNAVYVDGFRASEIVARHVRHTETGELGFVMLNIEPDITGPAVFLPHAFGTVVPETLPLYTSREDAYAAEGEVYQHYKGGVYRLLDHRVVDSKTGSLGVLYEHLFPHKHGYFFRPRSMFFQELPPEAGGGPRFKLIHE